MFDLLIVAYAQIVTKVKVQESLYWPIADRRGFQEAEAPTFPDFWHMKVVMLSTLCTVHLCPPPQELLLLLISFRG